MSTMPEVGFQNTRNYFSGKVDPHHFFLQMNQHLKLAHPKDGETNPVESPCGECGKNFQSKSALKFHIDTQHNNDISFAF